MNCRVFDDDWLGNEYFLEEISVSSDNAIQGNCSLLTGILLCACITILGRRFCCARHPKVLHLLHLLNKTSELLGQAKKHLHGNREETSPYPACKDRVSLK